MFVDELRKNVRDSNINKFDKIQKELIDSLHADAIFNSKQAKTKFVAIYKVDLSGLEIQRLIKNVITYFENENLAIEIEHMIIKSLRISLDWSEK